RHTILEIIPKRTRPVERSSPGLNDKPDGSPLLTVNLDLSERRNTDQINAVGGHEASADGDRLDRLIDGAGADGLHLRGPVLPQHGSQSTGDSLGLRRCGYLQDLHAEYASS